MANPYADAYPSSAQISAKIDKLAAQYPELAEKVVIGTSAEGRPIEALRIGTGKVGSKASSAGGRWASRPRVGTQPVGDHGRRNTPNGLW